MAHAFLLTALDFEIGPTSEIVIAGDPTAAGTPAMLRAARSRFLPRTLLVLNPPGAAGDAIRAILPQIAGQAMLKGQPTAYVCEHFACRAPVTDPKEFELQLDGL